MWIGRDMTLSEFAATVEGAIANAPGMEEAEVGSIECGRDSAEIGVSLDSAAFVVRIEYT